MPQTIGVEREPQWIVNVEPRPNATIRLVTSPYAGGGAHVFRRWAQRLPSWVELLALEPPGRGTRFREPLLSSLPAILESLAGAVLPVVEKPYVLFGHSLGALVVFELARLLRARGRPGPVCLLVSGRGAPHRPRRKPPIRHLPDNEFLASIDEYNGWPAEVRADKELVDLLLPVLRADFTVCETYEWRDGARLDCPIFAYHGREDGEVHADDVRAWGELTSARFFMKTFDGDHFFLRAQEPELLGTIERDLAIGCRRFHAVV